MRRSRLIAILLAAATAGSASAAGLRATLEVDRAWLGAGDDLVATVTIANDGAQALLLPRWQVPSARLEADLFSVTRDGRPVDYLGILVKRPAPTPADYVAIAPGESITGRTELTRSYDMNDGGEYLVSYRLDLAAGSRLGEAAPAEAAASTAVAIWRDAPASAPIDWEAINAMQAPAGLSYTNCSSSQQSGVAAAVSGATTYATGSRNYLNSKTYSTVGPRWTTWFGAKHSSRFNTSKSHFTAIESAFLNQPVVVDCGCTENYYAYVYPTQPYKIYVCNAFWSAPNTGTDSRAGTLVHEMSHFNVVAGTDDWAYGQTACRSLATRSPKKAVDNADSHEYFAENTPSQN
ncbi:MAG: peptidyl-Lys metalloendopeptidase [Acidobacteriota bacterium]|nr:peptidyl-Lys metalloendopeptidase [Acidobacteriota bacterium]